jgi:hypothetical protein
MMFQSGLASERQARQQAEEKAEKAINEAEQQSLASRSVLPAHQQFTCSLFSVILRLCTGYKLSDPRVACSLDADRRVATALRECSDRKHHGDTVLRDSIAASQNAIQETERSVSDANARAEDAIAREAAANAARHDVEQQILDLQLRLQGDASMSTITTSGGHARGTLGIPGRDGADDDIDVERVSVEEWRQLNEILKALHEECQSLQETKSEMDGRVEELESAVTTAEAQAREEKVRADDACSRVVGAEQARTHAEEVAKRLEHSLHMLQEFGQSQDTPSVSIANDSASADVSPARLESAGGSYLSQSFFCKLAAGLLLATMYTCDPRATLVRPSCNPRPVPALPITRLDQRSGWTAGSYSCS